MFLVAALVVLVALAGLAVGREVIRNNYYVTEHDGTVSIMRGIQGSLLGLPMQEAYLLACLNDRNELSQISYGQPVDNLSCRLMQLQDLRPSERAQVAAGLPGGSLDDAIEQMRELARTSLLPLCPVPAPAPTPRPSATPTPTPAPTPAPGTSARPAPTSAAPAPATTTGSVAPSPAASPTPSATAAPPTGDTDQPSASTAPSPNATTPPPSPSPTVTALPAPPLKPGTDCRAAA
jgi:protein phosphatase